MHGHFSYGYQIVCVLFDASFSVLHDIEWLASLLNLGDGAKSLNET